MPVSRLLVLLLLGWMLSSAGCKRETAERVVPPQVIPVESVAVKRQDSFTYPTTYYGRIEPARHAALSFELPGLLTEVLIDEGGEVAEGQVVARLDKSALEADRLVLQTKRTIEATLLERLKRGERDEVIAVARAEVNRMEVDLRQKEADRRRAESVYRGRAISKADYDQAVFAHESAKFALEQARQRLEELETGSRVEDVQAQASRVAEIDAQLKRLEVQFAKSELRAPFAAVCVRRHQDEGVTLAPGQVVLEINEVDRLEARFSIPQGDLEQVSGNSTLEINGSRYPIDEVRVISQVDQQVRAVDVVIPIHGEGGPAVLPGQTCTLTLRKCVTTDCLTLPITALVPSIRGLWSCYRLVPEDSGVHRVEKVEVSIIHTNGSKVVVTSALHDGDKIIRSGVHKVVPGMRVQLAGRDS
jgi:multidrug efflux pump subunit AcrA (membrane-fusion protein)